MVNSSSLNIRDFMEGIAGMELLLEVVAIPAELLVVVLAELFKDILPSWESTKDWYSWKFRSSDFGFDLLLDFCWNLFVFLIFSVNICFSYVWGLQCIQALSLKLIYLLLVLAHIFQILHDIPKWTTWSWQKTDIMSCKAWSQRSDQLICLAV